MSDAPRIAKSSVGAPRIAMRSVSKRFGATIALEGVTFSVAAGEVRGLIGENGAGKSTLMRILAGVLPPDAGSIEIDGARYAPSGPAAARAAGVAMIHQELSIAPDLSVEANVMLGRERARGGFVRKVAHRRIVRAVLARLAHGDLDPDARAGDLPIALRQQVEIARALAGDARVIVLDEPTSSLASGEVHRLFTVIRELAARGLAIVYVSHFLEEVREIADTFTVLRDGRAVSEGRVRETTTDAIVRAMVGREPGEMFPRVPHAIGKTVLELQGVSGARSPRGVSLALRRGEIFGLAGLVGAGRSQLLRCIFGLDAVRSGAVRVTELTRSSISGPARTPRASIAQGLGFVSEDRKGEGLALGASIEDNLTMTRLAPYARFGWLALGERRRASERWMQAARVKARSPSQAVGELSGGNQQKVAIARLLHQDADVLLLDEPTRGIDVGTKAEIYRVIGELAARGKSVLVASSYLPELVHVCDTIGVMCRGELVEVRAAECWSEAEIMLRATGAASEASA